MLLPSRNDMNGHSYHYFQNSLWLYLRHEPFINLIIEYYKSRQKFSLNPITTSINRESNNRSPFNSSKNSCSHPHHRLYLIYLIHIGSRQCLLCIAECGSECMMPCRLVDQFLYSYRRNFHTWGALSRISVSSRRYNVAAQHFFLDITFTQKGLCIRSIDRRYLRISAVTTSGHTHEDIVLY